MSAIFTASGVASGWNLCFTASSKLAVPGSSATITVQPLSRRFWAWAWPWEP